MTLREYTYATKRLAVAPFPALTPLAEAEPTAAPAAPAAPVAVVVLPTAPPAIWKAITPPKGPARFAIKLSVSRSLQRKNQILQFAIFIKHTFCCPATVPVHVVPAGTVMSIGKSMLTFDARATKLRARRAT